MTTPSTIDEVLAWVREQHEWLVRHQFTLVDTGRMSREEADRKRRLSAANVACIEALKASVPAAVAAAEPVAPKGPPAAGVPLEVNVRCGLYRYTRLIDAGRFLAHAGNRAPVMREIEGRMMRAALNHATGGKAGP